MAQQIGTSLGYGTIQDFTTYLTPNRVYSENEVYTTIHGVDFDFNGKKYTNIGCFNIIFTPMYGVLNAQKTHADLFLSYYQKGINIDLEKFTNKSNPSDKFSLILSAKQNNANYLLLASESRNNSVQLYSAYTTDKIKNNYSVDEIKKMTLPFTATIDTKYYDLSKFFSLLPVRCTMGVGELQGTVWNGFVLVTVTPEKDNFTYSFTPNISFLTDQSFIFGEFSDTREFSDEYGGESTSGGYGGGSFDDSSDAFGLPSLPSLGVSETGFVNVYRPTAGQLAGFADDLFPDFEMPTPSTKEGLEGIVENLNNVASVLGFFADSYLNKGLVDYVIDCHIIPVTPSITSNTGIKVGYKTFEYNPSKVTSDYVEFDCGSLEIAEYYQNFLDYEGTRAKLYCPFIGFVDIKPEWFQSGSLQLVYHFNVIDGSCIAFVIATSSKSQLKNTVVATFGGNCCVHMPITGLNYSSMISGIAGGVGKVASGIMNGNIGQIAQGTTQGVLTRPTIEQSNGYNAGMSFMCYRRPYLLIERPVASFSKNYPSEQGLPLNVTKKLSNVKGFTTCIAPIVDNFHCLEEEKDMIKKALVEGTIF